MKRDSLIYDKESHHTEPIFLRVENALAGAYVRLIDTRGNEILVLGTMIQQLVDMIAEELSIMGKKPRS